MTTTTCQVVDTRPTLRVLPTPLKTYKNRIATKASIRRFNARKSRDVRVFEISAIVAYTRTGAGTISMVPSGRCVD